MKRGSLYGLVTIGAVALALLFISDLRLYSRLFGRQASGGGPTFKLVQSERTARLGYSDEVPFAYSDPLRGLTGESPEVARAVLARLGVRQLDGVLTDRDRLVEGLYARRYELAAALLPMQPRLCRRVIFSRPIHAIGEAFAVRRGNPLDLHSYEDVAANPNAHLGVVTGSIQRRYAVEAGVPANRIRVLSAPAAGLASLSSGVIDAFAADAVTVQRLVDDDNGAEVERAQSFRGPLRNGIEIRRYGAFAFRIEDVEFARAFNRELKGFLGSAEHLALVRPFGITEHELPAGVTARDVCREAVPHADAGGWFDRLF